LKFYSHQIDDRYYGILEEEFDLASELQRLRDAKKYALADALEAFMAALTALPPRWSEAKALGTELADIAYDGGEREFEHFRNAIIRALSLLMFDLPETKFEMLLALKNPESRPGVALSAAKIVRIFGVSDFDPH
jgi:hypothetical protein